MKKSLLFSLACFCFILRSVAQPTLTAANTTPHIGEAFATQSAKAAGVSVKTGGANQTWDYSGLIDSGSAAYFQIVSPASTPYNSSFPSSNLALKTANDSAYVYFNSQTADLWELGVASSDTTIIKFTKPKIYLPYPFTYNSFFTDSVVELLPYNNYSFRGKDSLYGDGYGTLKIPGKNISPVLRVKYIENIAFTKDTIIAIGNSSVNAVYLVQSRTISYIYFAQDTHAPLLAVAKGQTSSSISVLGVPIIAFSDSTTSVSYLKAFTLPVSFASFNASLNNNEVALQWQTAQEINTDHFNVQRSLTGNNFEDITQVKATGNSSGSRYTYTDQDFAKSGVPPTVYYRIKETDKDGKLYYSTTAIVHGNSAIVSLYPNPAKTYINFNIKDVTVADAITIFDANGHMIQQWQNHQVNQPINVSNLSKGTYFVQVKIKDKTTTTTVVKE